MSYTISGNSIICGKCGRISYNANDIKFLYCGHCHQFHEPPDGIEVDLFTLDCYRPIAERATGHEHGSFLTAFAQALISADPENLKVLMPAARYFVARYNLAKDMDMP